MDKINPKLARSTVTKYQNRNEFNRGQKTIENINKTKMFLREDKQIDKYLTRQMKKKKDLNKTGNERGDITTYN